MCERRYSSLKQMAVKPAPKPVQSVNPEPATPLHPSTTSSAPYSSGSSDDCNHQQHSSPANKGSSRRTRAGRVSNHIINY
jgi:hypothetical protein